MKVLHPTDFSETADLALEETIRLSRALGAEVVLVHVLGETPPYDQGLGGVQVERIHAAQERWADEELRTRLEGLREAGLRARAVVRSGTPFREIAQVAENEHADLIVMGTHGRGPVARALLGSVADRLVRTAACPVVTVRRRDQPR